MKRVKLGDICEVLSGNAFKSKEYVEDGIRVIRITNVQKGEIVDSDPKFMPFESKEKHSRYLLEEGDILISQTGNVGRVGRMPSKLLPAFLNQRVAKLSNNSPDDLLDEYLFWVLNNDAFERDAMYDSSGVAQKNLSMKWIKSYEIPFPSISEQKAIVAKLDRAQRLIDIDKEMLAKYDNLTQSVFLEMFGDPVTNPKGWERKPMKEIGELKSGGTPSRKNKEYFTGDIDWYTTGELESMYLGEAEEKITETAIEESSAKLFNKGSLLIGMYDTSAFKLGILTGPGSSNQASANIKLDDEICNVEWLYYCLKIMRPSILHERRGIRQKNLTLGFLKKLEIIMPPLDKQLKFSQYLSNISNEKQATEKIAKKSEVLFSSLVQGAFG